MVERCGDCHFFAKKDGECRRHSPEVFVAPTMRASLVQGAQPDQGIVVHGFWPATRESNWCGEFEADRRLRS